MNRDKAFGFLALACWWAFCLACIWLLVGCQHEHEKPCSLALVERAGQCGPREHEAFADVVHGCAAQNKSLDEEEVVAASNPACIDRAREALCPRYLGFLYFNVISLYNCTAPNGRKQDEVLPCSQAALAAEKEVCKNAP